uniref:Ubiquitin specific peptidase like 1 n=1 Tax=Paramormyrops kingsleyae TaxID=1676925 RepID=A0A3B3T5S3_9TELE|nr:SUMO-specific isopeptidase USPL1 isoform X1 [Paramormyrops kingsleyae]
MVMFSMWPRTASDPKIGSDFPMSGEGTGLGVPAPALAGYLGKLPDTCPWCAARGQIHTLRTYRTSLQESVTLCPNPQCLFPLVSKPLEDVLASCTTGQKRKTPASPIGGHFTSPPKHPRPSCTIGPDGGVLQMGQREEPGAGVVGELEPDVRLEEEYEAELVDKPNLRLWEESEAEPADVVLVHPQAYRGLRGDTEAGSESAAQIEGEPQWEMEPREETKAQVETPLGMVDASEPEAGVWQDTAVESAAEMVDQSEPDAEPLDESKAEPGAEMMNDVEQKSGLSEDTALGVRLAEKSGPAQGDESNPGACLGEELTVAPPHLFWKNEQNLCWLDCLLVALVHCQALREHRTSLLDGASAVGRLLASYDKAGLLVKAREETHQQVVRVPAAVLQEAQANLDDVRMSIFKLLHPKLQCKLGEWETPVFALPILLKLDVGAGDLFQHAFEWVFECTACGHTFSNRCEKAITTFMQVLPDWHPLGAVHRAPCSRCHHKQQRRKMVLERLGPLFVLHFVEGLPLNDISKYAFDFQGMHYSVSVIIQYTEHMKHFVTWLRASSGVWLEFDDLKHPQCTAHTELPVPASQIHVVFWEVQGRADDARRSPRRSLAFPALHNDDDIVSALTVDDTNVGTTLPDISIGEGTLQDAFQGLSHNDIVTLTLVEVKVDAQGKPLEDHPGQEALSVPSAELDSPSMHSPAAAVLRPLVSDSPRKRGPKTKQKKLSQASEAASPVVGSPHPGAPAVCSSAVVSSAPNARWSTLLSKHPFLQSTPLPQRQTTAPSPPKAPQKVTDSFPVKAAGMFVGFRSNQQTSGGSSPCLSAELRKQNDVFKLPGPPPSAVPLQKSGGVVGATVLPQASPKLDKGTDALRHKLLKKLKAKKKKLAALNHLLKTRMESPVPTPDSTGFSSPSTVSSSTTAHSPAYDEFLADLLSPATTTSSLSPDSTGLLEMLTAGQDVGSQNGQGLAPKAPIAGPESIGSVIPPSGDDFLEEFMSASCVTESSDLNAFDLFF